MYIGDTDQHGLQHLVGELVSNSVDQFTAGNATQIAVAVEGDTVSVSDDGLGVPLDNPDLARRWLTELHTTASADSHAPHVHIHGASGTGIFAVNALSKSLEIRSSRNGRGWSVKCSRGEIIGGPGPCSDAPETGTQVTFVPDAEIFKGLRLDVDSLKTRLRDAPYLFPGLHLRLFDEVTFAPNGLRDLIPQLNLDAEVEATVPAIRRVVRATPKGDQEPKAQACLTEPVFSFSGRAENVDIQVAVAGRPSSETTWRTWCNGSITSEHGTHRDGLSYGLRGTKWRPLVALIHVVLHDPRYAGPTRGALNVPEIRKVISRALRDPLNRFCAEHRLGRYEEVSASP